SPYERCCQSQSRKQRYALTVDGTRFLTTCSLNCDGRGAVYASVVITLSRRRSREYVRQCGTTRVKRQAKIEGGSNDVRHDSTHASCYASHAGAPELRGDALDTTLHGPRLDMWPA